MASLAVDYPNWGLYAVEMFVDSLPEHCSDNVVTCVAHDFKWKRPIWLDHNGNLLLKELPKMEKSSMNTSMLSSISSWNMAVIQRWKVAGALHNLNGIRLYAKVPYGQ
ncbi:hypothetical protein Tco_1336266 [Tanacetum coccineum]